jgi:class 3 adenylate cyclase
MTETTEQLSTVRKVVVVFDICSSTTILEDLKATDNLATWRNLLIGLKRVLVRDSERLHFEIYKFIGDGWILLFPTDITKIELTQYLTHLSGEYDSFFDSIVSDLLQSNAKPKGLTFGVDEGELIRIEMNEQTEYLGRPINVASRLQGATKDLPGRPEYKALLSKNFTKLIGTAPDIGLKAVRVNLRNISGGHEYECLQYLAL